MKRAKIMLSALAVLAVVGSALAFKANKAFNGPLRCTTLTSVPTTFCPLVESYTTTTTTMPGTILACTARGAADNADCITTWVTPAD